MTVSFEGPAKRGFERETQPPFAHYTGAIDDCPGVRPHGVLGGWNPGPRAEAIVGVRARVRVGRTTVHPGISYTRGIDGFGLFPSLTAQTTALQIDVTVLF